MKPIDILVFLGALALPASVMQAQDMPRIEHQGNRHALIVDNKPFLMLGAQVNNSSSWPVSLPAVWPTLAAMHANTIEAPVYWQQIEPTPNTFDFSDVNFLITQAREHNLRLVMLWFGTWKNAADHYVPDWVKSDLVHYPRVITSSGRPLDVLSPHSVETLQADKHAFAALMHHLREFDSGKHTVILVQVENETGTLGAARDFSPVAQKLFEQNVPAELLERLHLKGGSWQRVFGADADEFFNGYYTARFVDGVVQAGKSEYPLPMYCNAWLAYPLRPSEGRDHGIAGQAYPSGGPQQANIDLWKAAAPSVDALAPDFYSTDFAFYKQILAAYGRPDNPLFIPEIGLNPSVGSSFFSAVGAGAFGFASFGSFGTDGVRPTSTRDVSPPALSDDFGLVAPVASQIAQLNFDGKVQSALQEKPGERTDLRFGDIEAIASFAAPGGMQGIATSEGGGFGRILVAQSGPLEFLVVGIDATINFRAALPASKAPGFQLEILRVEEGRYTDGRWQRTRILNGDQTGRNGLSFRGGGQPAVRITLQKIPLLDPAFAAR